LSRLPLIVLVVFLSCGELLARHSFFSDLGEGFYEKVIFSSESISTRVTYHKKRADSFISKPEIKFLYKKGIPLIEAYACNDESKIYGDIFFFKGKDICSKGVRFFPGAETVVLKKVSLPISIPGSWGMKEGDTSYLIYRKNAEFEDNSTPRGRVLKEISKNRYIDYLGRPVFPEFIYKKGVWTKVSPVREYFILKVKDQKFEIEFLTSNNLPFSKNELASLLGLKSTKFFVDTTKPYTYKFIGEGLVGVRIPSMDIKSESEKSLRGKYIFKLMYPMKDIEETINLKLATSEINYKKDSDGLTLRIKINKNYVPKQEMEKIISFITNRIPAFYIHPGSDN